MSLEGKTALVTGGGRGIGRAIAERLAKGGARVVVAGRTETEIAEVARVVAGSFVKMDVAARASIEAGLRAIEERVGAIDLLINNAGIAESAPVARTTDAMWDRMMAVNVTGAFSLVRALLPPMIARGFGRIVNVASNAGVSGYAYSSAYCATKHAMVGMTRAIAVEIARTPVTINAVCPGWVETRMVEDAIARIVAKTGRGEDAAKQSLASMSPQNRLVQPDEVAHVVAMLCADEAKSVHGQTIVIDGGQVLK